MKNPFRALTPFELGLWLTSVAVSVLAFVLSGAGDVLTLIASLIGVTALIFVAKGYVIGQVLTVVFAVFYGIISFYFQYYGEVITYLFMTAPIAVSAVISWLKNPYGETDEVKVNKLNVRHFAFLGIFTAAVTVLFYFVLRSIGNANLFFSTLSVATSFLASALTFLRSPYYALGYSANDLILIILWVYAAIEDISYLPMILCFTAFLANDLYGFFNWKRMEKRQKEQDGKVCKGTDF